MLGQGLGGGGLLQLCVRIRVHNGSDDDDDDDVALLCVEISKLCGVPNRA